MAKVSWAELAISRTHLLVAELDSSYFGGETAADPFDSHRLKEATNLMLRVGSRLELPERYAATPSRGALGQSGRVLCAYESEADRNRVADIVDARTCIDVGESLSRRAFPLTDEMHRRLVEIGGESDHRYAGRRRRERDERAAADSLRWTER